MEAVGSGLPLIGFDVRYGNQTFIDDGKNGYLIPVSSNQVEDQVIAAFVEKIVALFSQGRQQEMSQNSYRVAENFMTSRIEATWSQLLKEVRDDSAL
ncbi:Poly(glycerol-phosphate) alpha-glucosyltransferase GftA [Streptococcus gordonii]|uniref:Poly(Glycerol-phosphate) alpha-glucosyltransferase GftA n=1 Tax=Streptococcus gordonii TaxID=1302 RepID=A0A139N900_STRGN|nr:Poly(glycerol-phosphate) alpha-glucosyltransferase GftA [Streptococcus gordonii]